jgi:hypothetical protein
VTDFEETLPAATTDEQVLRVLALQEARAAAGLDRTGG